MKGADQASTTAERGMHRRGLLTTAAAALAATAAVTATAVAAPESADAELIELCAEFCRCEQRIEAIYEAVSDEELADAESEPVMAHQHDLAERIMGSRVRSAAGILAIARSLAVHAGEGAFDFSASPATTTGRLMTALFRESLLLSGLPVPDCLEGRAAA